MKKPILATAAALLLLAACSTPTEPSTSPFIRVQGTDLVDGDGNKFFIRGTNVGNWLNPEGYMFGFGTTNSPERINQMFSELVGPDRAAEFWGLFKDNYITEADVRHIASTGANTIRVPFHYKLFTDEDYMGMTAAQDGLARLDSIVEWSRRAGVYLILDMHDCPGGQTGDNIDDSYGYPWLMESEAAQQLFCDVWVKIATHYRNEPVILAYDLANEPIAPYFDNMEELNSRLEPLYKRAVAAIRTVDTNHVILLGGAQWNGNFEPFSDWMFDDNIMYTCHRYGGNPTKEAIQKIIDFRDRTNLPMYMGEIGHNTDEWMSAFCRTMEENNIGWTFWPYKKIHSSSFVGITPPEGWQTVVDFAAAPRTSYADIRTARPADQQAAWNTMLAFIENSRFSNCTIQKNYINALGLKAE